MLPVPVPRRLEPSTVKWLRMAKTPTKIKDQPSPVRSKVKVKSVCIYQFKLVKVKISDNVFTRSSGCGMSVRMKRTNCCPTSFVVWELSQQLTERSYKVLVLAGNRRPLFGLSGYKHCDVHCTWRVLRSLCLSLHFHYRQLASVMFLISGQLLLLIIILIILIV